ncbi:hypothetical protein AD954_04195 [Acetobacter cerevisiae]|uniref:Uncharacterized protein n=1 Tax=Acetobacter cerevisiae TaxID=178900 RepID=A0A149VDL8_9PROT|nr:hypothetical protein AD954_04195 [Acetobacter cerevisiae]
MCFQASLAQTPLAGGLCPDDPVPAPASGPPSLWANRAGPALRSAQTVSPIPSGLRHLKGSENA